MSPSQLRDALALLRWSQRGLAEALGCDDRLVRRWAAGDAAIPAEIAGWLATLAATHRAHPPPETWRSRRIGAAASAAT